MLPAQRATFEELLAADRHATLQQLRSLSGELDGIIAAASDVATDDEHDPEGATIAYERERTAAMVARAESHLADIAAALQRLDAGTYGNCERCGAPIGAARLQARPVARTCIGCAGRR